MRILTVGFENGSTDPFVPNTIFTAQTTYKTCGSYGAQMAVDSGAGADLGSNLTEIYVRFRYLNPSYAIGGASPLCGLWNSNGNECFQIQKQGIAFRWGKGPRSDFTAFGFGGILGVNEWCCIEYHLKLHATTGVFEAKVNGVTVLTFNGDTIYNGTYPNIRYLEMGSISGYNFGGCYDDWAVNDTTGAQNNSWVGQGSVRPILVDGNSAQGVNFTPSAGQNFQCVDEVPASDTDYVSSNVLDTEDLYTLDTSALPASGTVSAVNWIARAKLDVDSGNITPVVRSEGTTEQQTDIPLTTTYASKRLCMDVDPIDNAAWTLTKVNALELGIAVG